MKVRRAESSDDTEVVSILSEAGRWLASRGIDQWPDPFPTTLVSPALERGDTYLAVSGGRAIATFTLQWEDTAFWGDQPPDAGYVHRVAVRREAAGQGVGRDLLRWAADRTAERGRRFLRLDCATGNAPLRRYYEEQGFVHRGDVGRDSWMVSLYERECRPQ